MFKVNLGSVVSLRSAWATGDPGSKTHRTKEQRKNTRGVIGTAFGECCDHIISGPGGHPQTRKSSNFPHTLPARRPWARTSAAHNAQAFFPLLCLRLTSARPAYSCQTLWPPTYLNSQRAAQWILGAAGGETNPSLPGWQDKAVSVSLDSKGAWRAVFPQRATSAGRPGSWLLLKTLSSHYTRMKNVSPASVAAQQVQTGWLSCFKMTGHHHSHYNGTVSHLGNEIWGDRQAQKRQVPAWCGNAGTTCGMWHRSQAGWERRL